MSSHLRKKLVIVGIGGASCSGKTLLAKHIRNALPAGATIIHQDDLCHPEEKVPYSSRYPDLQDWDDPDTCIEWPKFRSLLHEIRQSGNLPSHASHDHLNKEVKVEVKAGVFERWKVELEKLSKEQTGQGVELVWFIVDGFVLYYDDVLRSRREERQVYVLQPGGVWVDPPQYFDKIVWPGYLKAHDHVFDGVETGPLKEEWSRRLILLTPDEGEEGMTTAFDKSCEAIVEGCRNGAGSFIPTTS
ncbi:hypothetical protein IAR55_004042 [Kwoniella newhampshirensis]|uniref:Nicotinamide riboside kinase n=1 Tax=Kwoniella newhampshirensis TaxID=1651941 RepID=A0AAW0YMH1_9TREE